PELVCREELEQLEHRLVDKLRVKLVELRLLDRLAPLADLRVELLRGRARPRAGEALLERRDDLWVLGRNALEERRVLLDDRLVRLLARERWLRLDLLFPLAEHEVELRRHRLLHPQRSVVVERRDPVRH